MNPAFLDRLDEARNLAGVPFVITSGYRCPTHNRAVGSTSDNHTKGIAADIRCVDSNTRYKIVSGLIKLGFSRIGLHKRFVHVDMNDRLDAIWFY